MSLINSAFLGTHEIIEAYIGTRLVYKKIFGDVSSTVAGALGNSTIGINSVDIEKWYNVKHVIIGSDKYRVSKVWQEGSYAALLLTRDLKKNYLTGTPVYGYYK